jgi:hypothetical protein
MLRGKLCEKGKLINLAQAKIKWWGFMNTVMNEPSGSIGKR